MASLPEGWQTSQDASGNTFYYNQSTGQTQWDPPAATYAASPSPASPMPAAADSLPAGWAEHVDPGSGNKFYHNATTNETSWERPKDPAAAAAAPAAAPAASDALPDGWAEHVDPGTGNKFYHNAATNETSWDRPKAPAAAAAAAPAAAAPAQEWSMDYIYRGWDEGEYASLNAQSGGELQKALLDPISYPSVAKVVEYLQANQIAHASVNAGFVIVKSNSKGKYFMIWRSDKEFEAFSTLRIANAHTPLWDIENCKTLGGPESVGIFSGKSHCITSLTSALEGIDILNDPQRHALDASNQAAYQGAAGSGGMGFIVIYELGQYKLFWARGKKDASFQALGLS